MDGRDAFGSDDEHMVQESQGTQGDVLESALENLIDRGGLNDGDAADDERMGPEAQDAQGDGEKKGIIVPGLPKRE